jgi:aminoglycoside phosphotransferase (APT) family kinase protein
MTEPPETRTLTDLARLHIDPRAACTEVRRTASGNSQETWIVEIAGLDDPLTLVLRRTAPAGTLEWSQRSTEVAALAAAAAAGLPVPRVRWWDAQGGALDRPYIVMDHARGRSPDLADASVRGLLADELGRWLARLHERAVVPSQMRRADDSVVAATADELARWTDRARATGIAPALALALCGWLTRTVPDDGGRGVLLWGDPGPHNVLTDGGGRITALLDWELAMVGHPALDVGAARWACLGHLDREALTSSYESERGAALDRGVVAWFEVLACVSRSVMLLDGVRAAIDGRVHDPNVVALGTAMLSANLIRGAAIAWGDEVTASGGAPAAELRPTPAERDDVVARFISAEVLPAIDDRRLRRGLRIAAALLRSAPDEPTRATAARGPDADPFALERDGRATAQQRSDLVAAMIAARRAQRPLLDLYGATTSISGP